MTLRRRRIPSQKRSQFLVDSVIQAGREAIASATDPSVSITRVADRAGVSIGSIYQYFSSKQQMIGEISTRQADEHRSVFERKVSELQVLPLEDALEKAIDLVCNLYLNQPVLLRNLLNLGPEWRRIPAVRRAREAMAEKFSDHLARQSGTLRKQNARLAIFVLMNSVMGTLEAAVMLPPGKIPADELRAELLDLCRRYLF